MEKRPAHARSIGFDSASARGHDAALLALVVTSLLPAGPALAQAGPAPYSLPWLLRPTAPASVVRVDETMAFHEDAASRSSGASYLTALLASYKLSPRWVPVFRVVFVRNDAPSGSGLPSGSGFSNPLLGMNYFRPLGRDWRLAGFLASTIPVGSGGGDAPDRGAAAAMAAAIPARSAMDNALFAVNYWTLIGGLGLARVRPGLTLQAELTLLQLNRVRGPGTQDAHRTNLTAGLHVGRFFTPHLSLGGEVRAQRWLTDAAPVRADPAARLQLTIGVGPRLHLRAGAKRWIRPGISWTRALDDPMKKKSYDILQVDVPLSF